MTRKFKLAYIAGETGVSISHASLLIRGLRHASWPVAKKFAKLTNSDPIIWADEKIGTAEKRQSILLQAELKALGERV